MKRILITLTMLAGFYGYSQIANLSNLLTCNDLDVLLLQTELLNNDWTVKAPVESYSEDKNKIVGNYSFTYNSGSTKQVLIRHITKNLRTNANLEVTEFISNDLDLYKKIIKEMYLHNFAEKIKKGGKTMYSNGNYFILIQMLSTPDKKLPAGCYSITVS